MIRVRMKDLALVAIAGGLLAFELVSLGEALPHVKKALAARGVVGRPSAASAGSATATSPALAQAGSTVTQAAVEAVKGAAQGAAGTGRCEKADRHEVVARALKAKRVHRALQLVSVKGEGSCAAHAVVPSLERLREIETALDRALKQASL